MRCKLKIKPLSVNSGEAKNKYKASIKRKLPKSFTSHAGKLALTFDFYFSNPDQDYDSPIKYTQDAICEKYNLEDKHIYYGQQRKHITKKGKEKIVFTLEPLSTFRFKRYWMSRLSYLMNFGFILIILLTTIQQGIIF